MKQQNRFVHLALILISALFIFSCAAKEGTTANTSATTVSSENLDTVVSMSSLAAERAIDSDSAPGRSLSNDGGIRALLVLTSSHFRDSGSQRNVSRTVIDYSDICTVGGSASADVSSDFTGTSGSLFVTYNNCAFAYDGSTNMVMNGTAEFVFSEDGSISYSYNLTTTYGTESFTLTGTMVCDASFNCTYEESFSSGGIDYTVTDVSISGDSSGYNVTARIYHEELGYVEFVATDLVVCSDSGFSSGTITVTDSTDTAVLTIDFVSCSQMTVTFQGVSTTESQ